MTGAVSLLSGDRIYRDRIGSEGGSGQSQVAKSIGITAG